MKRVLRWCGAGLLLLLAAGILAPYLSGNRFAPRIRAALESGLGRKVEIGSVHFSLFSGPGFSVSDVVIHENPAVGIEPVAYVGSLEAVPRLISLFGGRLEFASIRLDDASLNVSKSGPASEPGTWNFEPLLNRSVIRAIPELHVRNGRINFKFGDVKSVFYLMNTDLDVAPPARGSAYWRIDFRGEPARTDRPARGLGVLLARGQWSQHGQGRLDLDARLEKGPMSELVELLQGYDAGIHGVVSSHMRFTGPLDDIRFAGSLEVADVHRWDQMPPYGSRWPLRLAGRLNIPAQTLEVESSTAGGQTLPLALRFRCANYLSQPHWGVSLNWNQFPAGPLLDLASHMGAPVPAGLHMTGSIDGVLGYSGQGSLQGQLAFHDATLSMPGSPALRSPAAAVVFGNGHAHLAPLEVITATDETAQLEADFDWMAPALDVTVSSDAMKVESLRAQAALASIAWLKQVTKGDWKGQLHYHLSADANAKNEWVGSLELRDAVLPVAGLSEPVLISSAGVRLEGARVWLDHVHGTAGDIPFEADYRYEPEMARPHRLRLQIPEADAARLETVLEPSLVRRDSLLARALHLGSTAPPEWLATLRLDANIQIALLHLAGADARHLQTHLLWDGLRADFQDLRAAAAGGHIAGELTVNVRASGPAYRLQASLKGIAWKNGKLDAETALETSGTGSDLLARLHSSGAFTAQAVEMEGLPDLESIGGAYDVVWSRQGAHWRFTDLQVVSGDDTYTGNGSTQPDGRLLIQLTSGAKEMHMSGTLAELRLEQPEPVSK